jgi:dihydroorotase-like cyclic amidohydrolase
MSELTDLIIRNATILHPDGHLQQGDVAIAEGKIQEVASQVT